jgi:DNA-binding XRE family transcriptional regulator
MSKNTKKELAKTHKQMVAEWMTDPAFKATYDSLEDEYALLREMLKARQKAGLTQLQVAERMGTHAPAVARLEAVVSAEKHSPSLSTLRKYAHAVGCKLEVHLKPWKKQRPKT